MKYNLTLSVGTEINQDGGYAIVEDSLTLDHDSITPGVLQQVVSKLENLIRIAEVDHIISKYKCADCRETEFKFVVLKDEVWNSIAKKNEMLCRDCMEERLGRHLIGQDLKDL